MIRFIKNDLVIFGAYNDNNLGDDLILYCVSNYLNSKNINYMVVDRYNRNDFFTNNYNYLENPLYNSDSKIKKIFKLFCWNINHPKKLIFIGGGYTNLKFGRINILKMILLEKKFLNKNSKIYFTGQTIGPSYNNNEYKLLKKLYGFSNNIAVREKYSLSFFSSSFKDRVHLVGDDAFLSYPDFDHDLKKENYIIVNFKDFDNNMNYYNNFLSLITKIANEKKYSVHVVPFRNMEIYKEYKINKKLFEDLSKNNVKCKFVVLDNYKSLIEEFNSASIIIGLAYHCIALGLIAGANVYGFYNDEYYERKIKGILELYKLDSTNVFSLTECNNDKTLNIILKDGFKYNPLISNISKDIFNKVKNNYDEIITEK